MNLECALIVADWLAHPTYGANAILPSIPRKTGHAEPPAVAIENEFEDSRAAVGRPALVLPALSIDVVSLDVEENQVITDQGDGSCVVRIRYATDASDLSQAKRDGSYTIRAAAWSLRVLYRNEQESSRTLHSIRLRAPRVGGLVVRPYYEELTDRRFTAVCLAPFDFRDFATLPT